MMRKTARNQFATNGFLPLKSNATSGQVGGIPPQRLYPAANACAKHC